MHKQLLYLIGLVLLNVSVMSAQDTKNVRGQVLDKDSKFPINGASVMLLGSNPPIGASTDSMGYFTLPNVPLGRVSLRISYTGYKDAYANDVLVIAGKEVNLNIELEEKVVELTGVTISGTADKGRAKNEFATVSARSFEVEQTSRFSGSRNDPARMASNFAGVSGASDARNDIIIRGNSPTGLLWRLEGVDIPSPNHFASFGSTGGPVSMLNNNTLARSDFMTSAFPAEYGNAVAGVFDLKMRSGNKNKYEFLAQIGFNGVEVGAEGPFAKKKSAATFLFNYRYSTLGLFKLLKVNFGTGTAVPEYQDLSFKIDVPTKKAGTFRIWGLGGLSSIDLIGSQLDLSKPTTNLFGNENQDIYNRVRTGIAGFSHTYFITPKSYTKIMLAASHQRQTADIDTVNINNRTDIVRYNKVVLQQNKYTAHLLYNNKLNTRNTITTGIMGDVYDVNFSDSISITDSMTRAQRYFPQKSGKGASALLQAYVMWQHKFSDRLTLNTGLHFQYYTLSKSFAPEPRVGLRYQLNERQFITIGYGLHHQIQPLPTYYNYDLNDRSNTRATNLNMGFTRSQHLVAGYDLTFFKDFHFKTEVYFQYIDHAPIDTLHGSFSMLNAGADFATPDNIHLVNRGIGYNYGLELTMEKFFTKGYYFLLTGSFFESKYRGNDQVWRNTAFNGHYVVNALAGYEYKFGGKKKKVKRNVVAIDGKMTVAGGRYYTPLDLTQSALQSKEVRLDNQAYSQQYPVYLRPDAKISYRVSMRKVTHEFSIDFQNFINHKNLFRKTYNARTHDESIEYQQGIFILPQYRVLF